MTAPVTFTRTTYTNNDTPDATAFNAQSALAGTVPTSTAEATSAHYTGLVTDGATYVRQSFDFTGVPAGDIAGTLSFFIAAADAVTPTNVTCWNIYIKNGATVLRSNYMTLPPDYAPPAGPFCFNFRISAFAGGNLTLDLAIAKFTANNANIQIASGGSSPSWMVLTAGL